MKNPKWNHRFLGVMILVCGYLAGRIHSQLQERPNSIQTSNDNITTKSDNRSGGFSADSHRNQRVGPRRLFPSGGGKAWLYDLGVSDATYDPARGVRIYQHLANCDEQTAFEVAEASMRALKDYQDGKPEALKAFNGDDVPEQALLCAFTRLSELNPEKALDLIADYKDKRGREALLRVAYASFALTDDSRAIASLNPLKPDDQDEAVAGIVGVLAGKDPYAAAALLESYPSKEFDLSRFQLIEKVGSYDPAMACDMASKMLAGENDPAILGSTFSRWVKLDFENASEWASNYRGPGEATVKSAILDLLVVKDLEKALLSWHPDDTDEAFVNVGVKMVNSLAESDLAQAGAWVHSLNEGPTKDAALGAFVKRYAKIEPGQASEYLLQLEGSAREKAVKAFVEAVNRRFPEEAFEWVITLPEGKDKKEAMDELMSGWRQQDPEAAEAAWSKHKAPEELKSPESR